MFSFRIGGRNGYIFYFGETGISFISTYKGFKKKCLMITNDYLCRSVRERTFENPWLSKIGPAKIQISLRIRTVRSKSSLGPFLIAKDARFLHADNEDSDQTARMRRLI